MLSNLIVLSALFLFDYFKEDSLNRLVDVENRTLSIEKHLLKIQLLQNQHEAYMDSLNDKDVNGKETKDNSILDLLNRETYDLERVKAGARVD